MHITLSKKQSKHKQTNAKKTTKRYNANGVSEEDHSIKQKQPLKNPCDKRFSARYNSTKHHISGKVHLAKLNMSPKEAKLNIPVDLIRTIAIAAVILLHSTNDLTHTTVMGTNEIFRWWTVDIYQSIGRLGVPLFVMLTGALLLQPSKKEELDTFFSKRFARIGLPLIFWGAAYFIWDVYVEQQQVTQAFIVQGILTGPYLHFWYMYMLVGLYLITPFLRLIIPYASSQLFKYFAALWFVGTALIPFIYLLTPYEVDVNLFTIPAFLGYFVLGYYLLNVKVSRKLLMAMFTFGVTLSTVGTYIIAGTVGGITQFFFQEYVSPSTILASIALFLLLTGMKSPVEPHLKYKTSLWQRFLHMISENTLPIFFFHLMVLYALQNGYLGVTLNGNTVNSIVGVPLATLLTLLISLIVIAPLKKVPVLKRLLG